jgi:DNA-binding transcriptional ArsR family regulator
MRSSRFSPRSLEPAQLERLLVAREQVLAHLQDAVTSAVVTGQARFDLVIGPRGAGKSHLIGVLEGRLRGSPQLLDRTVIIAPPEELHPLSLVQFLAQLLRELPDDPELGSSADAVRSLQRQHDPNQERRAVDLIRARLAGRSLIILVENLDEVFTALKREGQQRLRNILQTERRWSIVASSRSLSPAFTKYEAPFHGTFNIHRLEPLSAEQCREMLAALADAHGKQQLAALLRTRKGLARVRGLHHLLGGNPRAMAFLFRQLDEHRLDHFEEALADLADELKPYLQEQMTRISPMQRAIMELLAESWRPLTVTELTESSFSAQASISNALKLLRSEALVQTLEVGRERYYELGDPLLRLARANERPREAIAAFARLIRWWYAEDRVSELGVRSRYVLPAPARAEWAAADRGEYGPVLEASLREASELLAQPAEVPRSTPNLEVGLARAIDSAWHHQRLSELLPMTASLDSVLAVLPTPTRFLVAMASVSVLFEQMRSQAVPDTTDTLRARWRQFTAEGPAAASSKTVEHELALPGVMLEALSVFAQVADDDEWRMLMPSSLTDPGSASDFRYYFEFGFYLWLASRRPLEPLVQLDARLREHHDLEWFPAAPLNSASPREAVARLSEPERVIVREQLERHNDRQGLAALALAAKR